jgi:single-stranded-DNA-specific exonuclease
VAGDGGQLNIRRRWVLNSGDPQKALILSRELEIPLPVARVLVNRGITEVGEAERFLSCTLRELFPPGGLADIDKAVDRIMMAIDRDEPIMIYGDYDTDGITATALLLIFLQEVGVRASAMIPHRQQHGYGLHIPLLQRAKSQEFRLIITVDCGISDHDALEWARDQGLDVIVTDHHEIHRGLPPAHAVINPKRAENTYPFSELAGVGVAFLLVWALAKRLRERGFWPEEKAPSLKRYLDMVAIGTIADQAPLRGENRTMVKHGLMSMNTSPSPGIRSLLAVCGMKDRPISVGSVSFQIAPRLNAAGRLSDASLALELLLAREESKAIELAAELDAINRMRQKVEDCVFREAVELAHEQIKMGRRAIVLVREGWHPGVIGIVASRLVEQYGLPTVLIAVEDGIGKGSARAPEGFHLMRGIEACEEFLDRYGGHAMAAGIRLDPEAVEGFAQAFWREAEEGLKEDFIGPVLKIDCNLEPHQVTLELLRHLARLEPHGVGNPEPVFQLDHWEIANCSVVGDDHLKLWIRKEGYGFDVIGFGMGDLREEALKGTARLACVPQINEWQGRVQIQLKLRDIRAV